MKEMTEQEINNQRLITRSIERVVRPWLLHPEMGDSQRRGELLEPIDIPILTISRGTGLSVEAVECALPHTLSLNGVVSPPIEFRTRFVKRSINVKKLVRQAVGEPPIKGVKNGGRRLDRKALAKKIKQEKEARKAIRLTPTDQEAEILRQQKAQETRREKEHKRLEQRAIGQSLLDDTSEKVRVVLRQNTGLHGSQIGLVSNVHEIARAISGTKTLVSVLCPDFETTKLGDREVFVPGGIVQSGIGLTGRRLLFSLPLVEQLDQILGGVRLVAIYHASAEGTITDDNRGQVLESAQALSDHLQGLDLPFETEVRTIAESDFLDRADEQAARLATIDDETLFALTQGREEIFRMRGRLGARELCSPQVQRREAGFDIAIHQLTEEWIQQNLGQADFVHLCAGSHRFARLGYKNPTIALCTGNALRFVGD